MDQSHRPSDDICTFVSQDGYFYKEDPQIGDIVVDFTERDFPFGSEMGIDLCKRCIENFGPVLVSLLGRCKLAYLEPWGPTGKVRTVMYNPTGDIQILFIQLWSRGSQAQLWAKGHRLRIPREKRPVGRDHLFHIQEGALTEGNHELKLERGGFMILDGRLPLKVAVGEALLFGFVSEKELASAKQADEKNWQPLLIPPEIEELALSVEKINPMIGTTFKVNKFSDEAASIPR